MNEILFWAGTWIHICILAVIFELPKNECNLIQISFYDSTLKLKSVSPSINACLYMCKYRQSPIFVHDRAKTSSMVNESQTLVVTLNSSTVRIPPH